MNERTNGIVGNEIVNEADCLIVAAAAATE